MKKKTIKLINIPVPLNINTWWNMGSVLSMMMMLQLMMGILLSMNYLSINPFLSTMNIQLNNNLGWMNRMIHSNLTSMIMMIMMIHFMRNMFFNTFKNVKMWMSGSILLMMMMTTSFLGYTLPWSQMSYWGMMVITNLVSIIPYLGNTMMMTIWGNFNINITSLNRMFTLHFTMPLMMTMVMMLHLLILHMKGSTSPLGTMNKTDMTPINSLFIIKDMMIMMMTMIIIMNITLTFPFMLNNQDNFMKINTLKTPTHIEPEWYFLFFYSILRMIPNKSSGLMMMLITTMSLIMIPMMIKTKFQSNKFYMLNKINLWMMIMNMILMSLMSKMEMMYPYEMMSKTLMTFMTINLMMIKLLTYTKSKS